MNIVDIAWEGLKQANPKAERPTEATAWLLIEQELRRSFDPESAAKAVAMLREVASK